MKRWSAIGVVVLLASGRGFAQTPGEVLQQAFANAAAATHIRSDLTYTIEKASVRQVLTKVAPDRTHLVITPAGGPVQEAIVIGKRLYIRQQDTWIESPAPANLGTPPNPAAGLEEILATLTERPRQTFNARPQRVFAGKVHWQAGRLNNEGDVEILIDAQRTLPTRTLFNGRCGDRNCTFTQTLDFSTNLTVTLDPALVRVPEQ